MKKNIFFAYESKEKSGSALNVDAIITAKKTLSKSKRLRIKTWEDLKNNGRVLIKSILDAIDDCDVFACDLTYLNHNVVFELGYAISKNKKVLLFINPTIENATSLYGKIDILRSIAYSGFTNANDICEVLRTMPKEPKLLHDLEVTLQSQNADIFYMKSSSKSQAEIDTFDWLQKSDHTIISDDPAEVEYRPLKWYYEAIMTSNGVIVHISDEKITDSNIHNAKASLFAGISIGMGRNTVLIAPHPYKAPVDYDDIMLTYENNNECIIKIESWLRKSFTKKDSYEKDKDVSEYNLLKLGLGCDIAENEKDVLKDYFIETSAYKKALDEKRAFFVGRKGTGKTALFIMLNEEFEGRKDTFTISLKPESSDLLKNVEVSDLYTSVATKSSFFHSIWKFVILSKLLIAINLDLSEKDKRLFYSDDDIEKQIMLFCENNKSILNSHFLETLKYIHENFERNPLNEFHAQYITPMDALIKKYLQKNKYKEVVIIADNLDKTWSKENDLDVQVNMLLALLEMTGALENELKNINKEKLSIRTLLFLRKDIFDFLINAAREPDKLVLNKNDIEWDRFPEMLKALLEKRFRYVLEMKDSDDISKVWDDYFELDTTTSVFDRIQGVCLPRPRDMLMFVSQMFVSAVNNAHDSVKEIDFKYALTEYSNFLYQNLIAEMSTTFPNIRNILDMLHEKNSRKIELGILLEDLTSFLNNDERIKLIDLLIENGYYYVHNTSTGQKYSSCTEAVNAMEKSYRKLFGFIIRPKQPIIFAELTSHYIGRREAEVYTNSHTPATFLSRISFSRKKRRLK